LEMHLYKQYLFKPQNVKLYSEQDSIVKFWSYVSEEAFELSCLGKTLSLEKPKKNERINMKIGLRVLHCSNTKKAGISVGEFGKKAIPSKLYIDKLKQVVISKYHLNTSSSLWTIPFNNSYPTRPKYGL
ncbi:hypothetical protein BDB01DRAFT_721512, partial [Pilobolus umbonatus]